VAASLRRNLFLGYGISLLLLLISATASYVCIRKLLDSQYWLNHTNEIIKRLEGVSSALRESESLQRGYLLTGNPQYLAPFRDARQRASTLISEARDLTRNNDVQQQSAASLLELVNERFGIMQSTIDYKVRRGQIPVGQIEQGQQTMNSALDLITQMERREQALLNLRTEQTSRFAALTPMLIIIASLLAMLVTIISFLRVRSDFLQRAALQAELEQTNQEIVDRIGAIEAISGKIAAGDFTTRVSEAQKESLGVLAAAFNKMAESLEYSFGQLAHKEWQQTGIATLNEHLIGERNLDALTANALEFLSEYTQSQTGAFYLTKNGQSLGLAAGVGLSRAGARHEIAVGEGIAGHCAHVRKPVLVAVEADTDMVLEYSAGAIRPKTILAMPVFYEKKLKGVIELATLRDYPQVTQDFLKTAASSIGIAIHSARDHHRLQELLAETQAQSEELQAQQSELENVNAELEAQAEKLQASEEELRVQQEELQQANQELEERSRLLEEKNELILERNLDIQRKAEELELSTKYKSEFLANMSHELRTPLNSILLLSRLLSENHEQNLTQDQVEYADVIQNSGKGLLTLIDEILDLSKIESGKMTLEFGQLNIAELAGSLRALFEPIAKDKGIGFQVELDETANLLMNTDQLRLEQILRNLLSNALKFTKRGLVALGVQQRGNTVSFSVRDTGIGIPADKQQTIFEAFQQADGSTRRQFGGTGLGLSISRELAKLLGGEISLHSEPGKGSEFTLTLPLSRTHEAPVGVPAPALADAPLPAEPQPSHSTGRTEDAQFIAADIPASIPDDRGTMKAGDKSILIVEDDTGFARSLLDYTRSKGYKGVVAVRGDEAISLAKQYKPLGILLDLQLPVKSGWEVMEALKNDKETRPIPVHMMSSHEARTRSLSKGAVDFISKPVAFEQLGQMFQKIEQALSRHPKKVLIVEENPKHAQALAFFLESYNVATEIQSSVDEGVKALGREDVNCVILDMGIPAQRSYEVLEDVKRSPGLEHLPIIVFTGKNLSHVEEMKIKQYADSIVVKTAHSYQRILDEVSLFLHLVEENNRDGSKAKYRKLGALSEVLKDKTVLIADDDVRNIFSLTKSLETFGMNVLSAMDGKDALEQLESHPAVDLVLMDMMMPEMDGYTSIRNIRAQSKYRNLPIIAVTAKAMTGDREKCIAAGASDYITKPVDLDQLTSLLRVWLYR
jgi:signal transduction histidine kinase/DNA-binding response OmpR family regulator/CHASE3 domain sensor protein